MILFGTFHAVFVTFQGHFVSACVTADVDVSLAQVLV